MYLFTTCIPSLVKCLLKSFAHCYWAVSSLIEFREFYIYSGHKSCIGYMIFKYVVLRPWLHFSFSSQ